MDFNLNPYLFFDGNAKEAMEFYKSIFGGALQISTYDETPAETKKNMPGIENMSGKIMHASLMLDNGQVVLNLTYPHVGKGYSVLGLYDGAICSVIDLPGTSTPDVMAWLEKQFGKQITTRTWKTVAKIMKKLDAL